MDTFQVFKQFPRLPQEIRLKIWRATIEPRVVRIKWSSQLLQCVTPDNPTILQVSHESREEGLRTYRPSFDTTNSSGPIVYANFSLDTVCFDWVTAYRHLNQFRRGELKGSLKQTRSLSISKVDFKAEMAEPWVSLLAEFSELEVLIVSGCTESRERPPLVTPDVQHSLEHDIKTHIFAAGSDENSDSMPTLVCLDRGYECLQHWWFKQCNEWCPRRMGRGKDEFEKPDWISILSSLDRVAKEYTTDENLRV